MDRGTDFGLSPKQLEIVRKAHLSGYFDVPRQVTQQELADHFGISSSAVSQRLRRATAQILGGTVSSDDTAGPDE
jgi:predicted DNA binding protein